MRKDVNILLTDLLAQDIANAEHITVLTGAGISAESGVPTFRGEEGLWRSFKPEELATVAAFEANPELVWTWYNYRREILSKVHPNAGHYALARWESLARDFRLVTQNVDGLHRVAGSSRVIELHGNIGVNRCFTCNTESPSETSLTNSGVPRCMCGGMLRPGVVWFGEALPDIALAEAYRWAESCDLFLSVGTSASVYPAAALPSIARNAGAVVIEVNIEETPFTSQANHHLRGPAATMLPELLALYEKMHPHSNASTVNP
jgi:NAD-dependent deacetylase